MQLNVKDVARLLKVTEKSIYRWIKDGSLPAYRIMDQYRFNRAELLEWASSRKLKVSPEIFLEPESEPAESIPSLEEALRTGGVFYRVGGTTKESALRAMTEIIPLPEGLDRHFLLEVLLARESLGSTAVGDGIAIPHLRNPILLHVNKPIVTLCFLETPVAFDALDGRPVHTLFLIICPSIRTHLKLLSELTYALKNPDFAAVLARQGAREEILQECRKALAAIPRPSHTSESETGKGR